MSDIIQSGGILVNMTGYLGKKVLIGHAVPLAEYVLPKLATKATFSVLDKFERRISRHGAIRAGKGFTLFILNEDMDGNIKIVKSLENSGLLIDGATEIVKHQIKKQEVDFLVL